MRELKKQITNFLSTRTAELTDFCARLVQTPSVNGVDPERPVAELIAAEAARLGLPAQLLGLQPERPNIVVSTAESGPTGLLLVGHTDTVPPGNPAHWTHPPFGGQIDGGRLFGRGAIDNKGGIAAALYALAALKTTGALAGSRAQFIGVPDEESGATGTLGVKFLAGQGLISAPGGIYVYPGLDELPIGHRGVTRFKVTAAGRAGHTGISGQIGQPPPGENAVLAMANLLLELERTPLPLSAIPYFDRFAAVINPGTVISGGVNINIVPDSCEALVDVRTIPEFDRPQAETALQQAIARVASRRPAVRFELELLTQLPPVLSNPAAPLFACVQQAAQQVTGAVPPKVVCGPANEGYLFIEQGIPLVCGFGPTGANAHGVDEYVDLDSLTDAALIYALTAVQLAAHLPEEAY